MQNFKYVIKDELGIHARPAGMLAKVAKEFESNISIVLGEKKVSAKGVMGIMTLAVKQGAEVEIEADGADEEKAIEALKNFFEENL